MIRIYSSGGLLNVEACPLFVVLSLRDLTLGKRIKLPAQCLENRGQLRIRHRPFTRRQNELSALLDRRKKKMVAQAEKESQSLPAALQRDLAQILHRNTKQSSNLGQLLATRGPVPQHPTGHGGYTRPQKGFWPPGPNHRREKAITKAFRCSREESYLIELLAKCAGVTQQ